MGIKKKNIKMFSMNIRTNDDDKFVQLLSELTERGIKYTMAPENFLFAYAVRCTLSLNDIISLMEIGFIDDDELIDAFGTIS